VYTVLLFRSGFKTSPQSQSLRWALGSARSEAPALSSKYYQYSSGLNLTAALILNPIEGFETASRELPERQATDLSHDSG